MENREGEGLGWLGLARFDCAKDHGARRVDKKTKETGDVAVLVKHVDAICLFLSLCLSHLSTLPCWLAFVISFPDVSVPALSRTSSLSLYPSPPIHQNHLSKHTYMRVTVIPVLDPVVLSPSSLRINVHLSLAIVLFVLLVAVLLVLVGARLDRQFQRELAIYADVTIAHNVDCKLVHARLVGAVVSGCRELDADGLLLTQRDATFARIWVERELDLCTCIRVYVHALIVIVYA